MSAFDKLARLTESKCKTCVTPDKYRCCDKMFCRLVWVALKTKGQAGLYEYKSDQEIPYMGEKGCTVAPEHRPYCTGYVCTSQLEDRTFRREYERLCSKAGIHAVKRSIKNG